MAFFLEDRSEFALAWPFWRSARPHLGGDLFLGEPSASEFVGATTLGDRDAAHAGVPPTRFAGNGSPKTKRRLTSRHEKLGLALGVLPLGIFLGLRWKNQKKA